jgi:hypothetical protein
MQNKEILMVNNYRHEKDKNRIGKFYFQLHYYICGKRGRERVTKAAMTMNETKGSIMEVDEGSRVCDGGVWCCESMAVEKSVTPFLLVFLIL